MLKRGSKFLIVVFISFVIAFSGFAYAKPPVSNPCPIQPDTNVVFYGQTGFGGVGDLSKSWITHFFDWWKQQDPSIKYVILDSGDLKTDCNLANYPNVKIYVQPGGNAYYQQKKLDSAGKNNINNYIDSGKGYVGICAGFYYAAGDYYWQGSYYDWNDLLGRYPTVEGSLTDIADYDSNPGYAMAPLSNGRNAIYYGGPTLGWRQTTIGHPGTTDSTFASISGNLPAVIKNGNMLLTSVHLEAYENDGISGLSTFDRTENYKYLANLINEVSGTNFYVPVSIEPQCSDGIDNDNDTLIDYPNDLGCVSLSDNSEIDSNPGEIFFDDFESGISAWTTSSVSGGNAWVMSTANPYQGSYHAQSNPMSTSEPASILEKAISTIGFSNIKVSYYRKLVGLDSADEFKVKWYDGTTWNVLEQTGSNSANDAGYVYKEFNLPSSAGNNPSFKVRFECTAGAVSEFCRVDNFKISTF
ncbi:MAG: BPL-N domain-containing protein [Nanoarchaeota archaeon]